MTLTQGDTDATVLHLNIADIAKKVDCAPHQLLEALVQNAPPAETNVPAPTDAEVVEIDDPEDAAPGDIGASSLMGLTTPFLETEAPAPTVRNLKVRRQPSGTIYFPMASPPLTAREAAPGTSPLVDTFSFEASPGSGMSHVPDMAMPQANEHAPAASPLQPVLSGVSDSPSAVLHPSVFSNFGAATANDQTVSSGAASREQVASGAAEHAVLQTPSTDVPDPAAGSREAVGMQRGLVAEALERAAKEQAGLKESAHGDATQQTTDEAGGESIAPAVVGTAPSGEQQPGTSLPDPPTEHAVAGKKEKAHELIGSGLSVVMEEPDPESNMQAGELSAGLEPAGAAGGVQPDRQPAGEHLQEQLGPGFAHANARPIAIPQPLPGEQPVGSPPGLPPPARSPPPAALAPAIPRPPQPLTGEQPVGSPPGLPPPARSPPLAALAPAIPRPPQPLTGEQPVGSPPGLPPPARSPPPAALAPAIPRPPQQLTGEQPVGSPPGLPPPARSPPPAALAPAIPRPSIWEQATQGTQAWPSTSTPQSAAEAPIGHQQDAPAPLKPNPTGEALGRQRSSMQRRERRQVSVDLPADDPAFESTSQQAYLRMYSHSARGPDRGRAMSGRHREWLLAQEGIRPEHAAANEEEQDLQEADALEPQASGPWAKFMQGVMQTSKREVHIESEVQEIPIQHLVRGQNADALAEEVADLQHDHEEAAAHVPHLDDIAAHLEQHSETTSQRGVYLLRLPTHRSTAPGIVAPDGAGADGPPTRRSFTTARASMDFSSQQLSPRTIMASEPPTPRPTRPTTPVPTPVPTPGRAPRPATLPPLPPLPRAVSHSGRTPRMPHGVTHRTNQTPAGSPRTARVLLTHRTDAGSMVASVMQPTPRSMANVVFVNAAVISELQSARERRSAPPSEHTISGIPQDVIRASQDLSVIVQDETPTAVQKLEAHARKPSFRLPSDVVTVEFVGEAKAGETHDAEVRVEHQLPWQAYALLVLAITCASTYDISMQLLEPGTMFLKRAWRSVCAIIVCVPWAIKDVTDSPAEVLEFIQDPTMWLGAFLYGCGNALYSGCYIWALSYTSLADAFLLTNCHTIVLLCKTSLYSADRAPLKFAGTIVSMIGAWITCLDTRGPGAGSDELPTGDRDIAGHVVSVRLLGNFIALLGAAGGVLQLQVGKFQRSKLVMSLYTIIFTATTIPFFLVWAWMLPGEPDPELDLDKRTGVLGFMDPSNWLGDFVAGPISAVLGNVGYVAILKYFDPLVLANVMLGDQIVGNFFFRVAFAAAPLPSTITWVGSIVMLLGVGAGIFASRSGSTVFKLWYRKAKQVQE